MATNNINLNSILESIDKILSNALKYISYTINIYAFYFNILLQIYYKSFIKKLEEHKESLEQNIKQYIENITRHLSKNRSRINRLNQKINKIESQIKNFDNNYKQIGHTSGYHRLKSIIQTGKQFRSSEINQIFLTLVNYRNALRIFKKHKSTLLLNIQHLEFYLNQLIGKKVEYETLSSGSSIIDPALNNTLEKLKFYLGEFDKYVKNAKLKEISDHIKTMKSKSNQVKDKLNPEFKKHIEGLSNIDIDYSEFNQSFRKINSIADSLIKKFNIANKAIDLYNQIDSETSKLTGVTLTKYDISELIKNSSEIKEKLTLFKSINLSVNTGTIDESVPGIKETEEQYSSDVSSYQSLINYLLYEISFVIYTYYLLQIMILYSTKISDMPNKINKMADIDTALSTLPEIVKDLVIFYRVHNSSINNLALFHLIRFVKFDINKYIKVLIWINFRTEILILTILCYIIILSLLKFLQDVLQSIISNRLNLIPESKEVTKVTDYTSNIIKSLRCINCHLVSLKSISGNLNVKYNLDKIRTCIKEISEETNQIKNNIDYLNKGALNLYIINLKISHIKMYVGQIIKKIISFIDYLFYYYIIVILFIEQRYIKSDGKQSVFLILSNSIFEIIKGLKKIEKEVSMNENIYEGFIRNFINKLISVTNNIRKLTREMDEYVKIIQKVVIQVECAIEGVNRNFIW